MFFGSCLCEPAAMVKGNDGVLPPVHDKDGATDLLDISLVGVEVKAAPDTGRTTTGIGLRVYYLDARKHGGVQDYTAQRVPGRQVHGGPTTDTLTVDHDLLRGHACRDEVGVRRLGVLQGALDGRHAGRDAVAGVLQSNNVHAELLRKLTEGAHHNANVCGIAMAMQEHKPLLPARRCIVDPWQPDYRDLLSQARLQKADLSPFSRLVVGSFTNEAWAGVHQLAGAQHQFMTRT
mmetsp:Transcript_15713/g.47110  ORF Transcript_15713/g.47110 Transcript_15713/m.47110 type:complete len:234 (-) Transcript_15713:176-877(-)